MPPIPVCPDCSPLSAPENMSDYLTAEEVYSSTVNSPSTHVFYGNARKGQVIEHVFSARKVGKTGYILLVPFSGNPNLKQIFVGSQSHPDFVWTPGPKDILSGPLVEVHRKKVTHAASVTVRVTSASATAGYAIMYFEK